jgi:ATP-dependent DNA helicase PIF1
MIKNLNSQQKKALKLLLNTKQNLFITGAAGTGKSHVIKMFREVKKMTNEQIPMVASTGAAAILVNGVTFNSYFGLGIMAGGIDNTIKNALSSRSLCERIVYSDTVIIDEISMISAATFRAANLLCQKIRQNKSFFGGIRIIAVGDFFQLGPFSETEHPDWIFEGDDWIKSKIKKIELTTIMRTKDKTFLNILAKARHGKVDATVKKFLNKKIVKTDLNQFDGPRIFSRNKQVDQYNGQRLSEIPGTTFSSQTIYAGESNAVSKMKENLVVSDIISLKKGALVMLRVNNFQDGYVNGTLGHVIGLVSDILTVKKLNGQLIQVKKHVFEHLSGSGEIIAKAKNFPITLAWAITIHKSQGASIEKALISLDNLWLHGQAYTALSRLTSAEGLHLVCWDKKSFIVDKKVLKFSKKK